MGEEPVIEESVEEPVKEEPVEVEPCDHVGKLEAVSAVDVDVHPIAERRHSIFQCKSCKAVVIKDKE